MEKLPPEVAHVSMGAVHSGALAAASIARSFEEQAHRFADFVSKCLQHQGDCFSDAVVVVDK